MNDEPQTSQDASAEAAALISGYLELCKCGHRQFWHEDINKVPSGRCYRLDCRCKLFRRQS